MYVQFWTCFVVLKTNIWEIKVMRNKESNKCYSFGIPRLALFLCAWMNTPGYREGQLVPRKHSDVEGSEIAGMQNKMQLPAIFISQEPNRVGHEHN